VEPPSPPRTGGSTRGGRVASGSSPLVQLERSQRTRAPPSYLKDFLCDAVDKHPSAIIQEMWGFLNIGKHNCELRTQWRIYTNATGNTETGEASSPVKGGIM